jgi:hypothetical protein
MPIGWYDGKSVSGVMITKLQRVQQEIQYPTTILVLARDSLEQLMSEIFGWSDISAFKSTGHSPSEKS